MEWYHINNVAQIDTPSLVIYTERVKHNIDLLVKSIDDVNRLRPHIKTCKAIEPVRLMMQAGINKFKCATIAEAEMLGMAGAADVLLAYQPVGTTVSRFIALVKKYPDTQYSCLLDCWEAAKELSTAAVAAGIKLASFIDLDIGMGRTGIQPGQPALELYEGVNALPNLQVKGLHAYDGHLHDKDFTKRTQKCDVAFTAVETLEGQLIDRGFQPIIIAGGSPTFPIHATHRQIECSPGTFIYWDKCYADNLPEQPFLPAAVLLAQVVSMPGKNRLCINIGHKAVGSENELAKRVHFLNAPDLQPVGHSEEHLVVEAGEGHGFTTGDILYVLPYHICPTVALHQYALTVEHHQISGQWKTVARDRRIKV